MRPFTSPRLIADIGITFARFAVETAPGRFEDAQALRCAEHADFHATVSAYLRSVPQHAVRHAAVAIANPVEGDQVQMTNSPWRFSIEAVRAQLGLDTLLVVNDFTALAMALPRLAPQQCRQVGGGMGDPASVIGVLGCGSGLGVSGLVPAAEGWTALATEGGHASVAPRDATEMAILQHAMARYGHVSFERLLSGPGLECMLQALAAHHGLAAAPVAATEITRRALAGEDALCRQTVDVFCALLGSAAANLALSLGARGGIFIGGSIVPRLGLAFDRSPFRSRFEDHGRFSAYLRKIPTWVITAENGTVVGASAILDAQLTGLAGSSDAGMLEQVRRAAEHMSPAERRVADHVLAHARAALNDPIAEIARAAGVSQPTVMRFCRSLGCEGLSDFKLRLAAGLKSTIPVSHAQVTHADSVLELGAKVLGNTAAAILHGREHLSRAMFGRAIALLGQADRIEFHALGHSSVVAQDAQYKFLRFGIATAAYTDPRMLTLAADVMRPGDVAVLISSGGGAPELLDVAGRVQARGAKVVAIGTSQSPLVRKADAALVMDHAEDPDTQLPMVSRILQLLVIDILAVGVAMQRGPAGDAATMLASLTSHSG